MPIINNNLGYQISRTLKTIQVKRIGSKNIDVQLFIKTGCSSNHYKEISNRLIVDSFIEIKIPLQDGKYKVRITATKPDESFEYVEYSFDSYNNLLGNIVSEIKDKLCGCDCKECNDCNEDKKQDNTLLKVISFYLLNNDYYSFFFNAGLQCVDCKILEDVSCLTLNEYVTGTANNDKLIKKILSYFYIVFYAGQKAMSSCCIEEIDEQFDINNMSKCIDSIDINCVFDKIETNPNYHISDSNLKLI